MSNSKKQGYRVESDSVGELRVPQEVYYGVQSMRAHENFPITGIKMHPLFIKSLAEVKKAAALKNMELGRLSKDAGQAIIQACEEISADQFVDQFIVDAIQGGAGTSTNMNINEVVANRANELLGSTKGSYAPVHPNDHVNYGQSTNDVIPTAGKLTVLKLSQALQFEMVRLNEALVGKAEEFDQIVKLGRTQMQDAIPIRLGQEFGAYSTAVKRSIQRLEHVLAEMRVVNLGGTAIGTGLNAHPQYVREVVDVLANVTNLDLEQASDLIDATQHIDSFSIVSGVLKTFALSLSKIANDLRLMSSGPKTGFNEINLPKRQNGSSIMPGKINPVIAEVVSQIAFRVAGNDLTISMAVEAGQLELNAFEPVIFHALFESLEILKNGVQTFTDNCIIGITANEERIADLLENSIGMVTALVPVIGYSEAALIANRALESDLPMRQLILEEDILSEEELDQILQPYKMTHPQFD